MPSTVLLIGLAGAVFVGFDIGGPSTGIAFGPSLSLLLSYGFFLLVPWGG